jgi:hypothetical protein
MNSAEDNGGLGESGEDTVTEMENTVDVLAVASESH